MKYIGINYDYNGDGYKTLKRLIEDQKGKAISNSNQKNLQDTLKKYSFVGKIKDCSKLEGFLQSVRDKDIKIKEFYTELEMPSQNILIN